MSEQKTSTRMPLPDLPKQIKGQEADFGLTFRRWWEKHPLQGEIELKDTKGKDSLPFSALDHAQEVIARMATEGKGVLVRRTVGTTGGADYTGLTKNSPYWIVINYPGGFEVISITAFLWERDNSKRKSLTSLRAREISTYSG